MSRRSLGGGRVLGNNQHASPSATQAVNKRALQVASTGLLSPSESSNSLTSQSSTIDVPGDDDLTQIAHRMRSSPPLSGPGISTNGSTPNLTCPICDEQMLTLLQLNRHLDDNHQELEETEHDQVQNWFEAQVAKAKKFQPLAVINQRLRGLDVFESNTSSPQLRPASAGRPGSRYGSPAPETPRFQDPDEVVQRTHWQRMTARDTCSEPICGRKLGTTNGQVNCRHCGKLFCDDHTMYQMRLSRSAQHEPVRGLWCRVCETCFKSRVGYNDHTGAERTITNEFLSTRKRKVDHATLEVSRLEKRLTKLTMLLAEQVKEESQGASSFLWGLGGKRDARAIEQSVVSWEDDASVAQCPFCHQPFTQYSFRRHHCRICGRVVCADAETGCSSEVALQADTANDGDTDSTSASGKPAVNRHAAEYQDTRQKIPLDIRMCRSCSTTLFAHSDFIRSTTSSPPDLRAWQNLQQFEIGIRALLPKYQRLLHTLQSPPMPQSSASLTSDKSSATHPSEAIKIRKRLTEAFTRYDTAARRIRDLPTTSPTQSRLNKAVYSASVAFLHTHMLPLKQVPKILSRGVTAQKAGQRRDSSASSSINTAALSALESEEKELRDKMIVLEEQRFLVQDMLETAKKKRRFDEVAALSGSVEELEKEIEGLQTQLSRLDWQGAYG